jgi:hypothetical protein
MGLLTVLMWVIGLVALGGIGLVFVGSFALENDKAKANAFLANQYEAGHK